MWITLLQVTLLWISTTLAHDCVRVLDLCRQQRDVPWTRCFDKRMAKCSIRTRHTPPDYDVKRVNSFKEAEVSPTKQHSVHIPSSALQRVRAAVTEEEVLLVATVINSTFFKLSPTQGRARGRKVVPEPTNPPRTEQNVVLGGLVLAVVAGNRPVTNLLQPVKLTFKHDKQEDNGVCVFWKESKHDNGTTGHWSTHGCETTKRMDFNGSSFICSCNHLSFFAVLVNPILSVDESDAVNLSYITYIGSGLSICFTVISLIIYICLQRQRPEKAIGVHLHLTAALLCLHLSFLLCSFWVWWMDENPETYWEDWVCQGLGLFLHWSLLATFTWTALEGFHLYLLLVRVFNIYVRRYLLKLSLVGWGLPMLIAGGCGIAGVYGKFSPDISDATIHNSTAAICWIKKDFPQRLLISFVTTVALPGLVVLCNSCMLGMVVYKLWGLRAGSGGSDSSWKKLNREKGMKLWKDSATVLGLSCVLGVPWGLATTTYISTPGIYIFTILNSLQGVIMFLWSLALSCKSRSDNSSSSRDPSSSQKVMTTSF